MHTRFFSPAKLNLFLAITGRRSDGFHDLVSVVTPVAFGDTLTLHPPQGSDFTLSCSHPEVPSDASNLILRAARAFAERSGSAARYHFELEKRIPLGAGLGGGSSNAATTLLALNAVSGSRLSREALFEIAATLGSDCPLFLEPHPVIMRGRGERLEVLPASAADRLSGRTVLLFKPEIGISTPWAYRRMIERATDYLPSPQAEDRLQTWIQGQTPAEDLLFNNMEPAAFEKFIALPTLLATLSTKFGLRPRMSGSGSACYAFLPETLDPAEVISEVRAAWGSNCFTEVSKIP